MKRFFNLAPSASSPPPAHSLQFWWRYAQSINKTPKQVIDQENIWKFVKKDLMLHLFSTHQSNIYIVSFKIFIIKNECLTYKSIKQSNALYNLIAFELKIYSRAFFFFSKSNFKNMYLNGIAKPFIYTSAIRNRNYSFSDSIAHFSERSDQRIK